MAVSALTQDHARSAIKTQELPAYPLQESYPNSRDIARRNERLKSIGEMTAEFAHQVRTPLATVLLYASRLDTSTPANELTAKRIVSGLNELKRMTNDMLAFAAGTRAECECVNVARLLRDVKRSIRPQLSEGARLSVSVTDPNLSLSANRFALKGALMNLAANADQASVGATNVLLHAHRFGNRIHLCVTDDGPGIPAQAQRHLFKPFYTTRPQGTGLGLAVVDAVANAHGGRAIFSSSSRGTTFTIELPVPAITEIEK